MTKILYRILLNEAKDPEGRHIAPCDGYKPEHPLVQSYSNFINIPDQPDLNDILLNHLWEVFNVGHPSDYRNRSLCIGDVIVLERSHRDCVAFAVGRGCDFDQIEVPVGHSSLTAVD